MEEHQGKNDFSHSITDLMASVAVIFLLIAGIFIIRTAKQARESTRQMDEIKKSQIDVSRQIDRLLKDLQNANSNFVEKAEKVTGDPFLAIIRLKNSRFVFENNQCKFASELKQRSGDDMKKLLMEIYTKVANSNLKVEQVVLEGHTDHNPSLPKSAACGIEDVSRWQNCSKNAPDEKCKQFGFENNIQLSAARAQELFFVTRAAILDAPNLLNWFDEKFVVSGRGPVSPLKLGQNWKELPIGNTTAYAENRRVEAKIRFYNPANDLKGGL